MSKLDLLARIQTLSALLHSQDLSKFNLSEVAIQEMKECLEEMSEQYIALHCKALQNS